MASRSNPQGGDVRQFGLAPDRLLPDVPLETASDVHVIVQQDEAGIKTGKSYRRLASTIQLHFRQRGIRADVGLDERLWVPFTDPQQFFLTLMRLYTDYTEVPQPGIGVLLAEEPYVLLEQRCLNGRPGWILRKHTGKNQPYLDRQLRDRLEASGQCREVNVTSLDNRTSWHFVPTDGCTLATIDRFLPVILGE